MTVLKNIIRTKGEAVTPPPFPRDVDNSSFRKVIGAKGFQGYGQDDDEEEGFTYTRPARKPIQIPWKKIFKWLGIGIGVPIALGIGALVWVFEISPGVVNGRYDDQEIRVQAFYEESLAIAESRNATDEELETLERKNRSFGSDLYMGKKKTYLDWDVPENQANYAIADIQKHLATILSPEDRAAAEVEAKAKAEGEAKIKAEVEAKAQAVKDKAMAVVKAKAKVVADAKAKVKAKADAEKLKVLEEDKKARAKQVAKMVAADKAKAEKKDYVRSASSFKKALKKFDDEVVKYNKVAEEWKVFNVKSPAAPKAPAINLDGVKTSKEVDALTSQIRTLAKQVSSDRKSLDKQLNRAKVAEKKKQNKLSKISKKHDEVYEAYKNLHKNLHSAMSNASSIKKLKPYIAKISSKLISKEDITKVGTYNERVTIYNKNYKAYKSIDNDTETWKKTIKKYNSGRL